MSKLTSTTLGLSLAAALAAPAWGVTVFEDRAPSGAHYRNGYGEPTCSISNLVVSCTGTQIAGVGNNDADILLTVNYSAVVQCRNHGGKIVDVKTQTTPSIPAPDDATVNRNGTLVVSSFSSGAPPSSEAIKALATCPNPNWSKVLLSVSITSYTYTLTFQGYNAPAITVTGSGA